MVALAAPGGGDSAGDKLRLLLMGARNAPSDLARWAGQVWQGMKEAPGQGLAAQKAFLDGVDPTTGKTVEQMPAYERADQLAHFVLNNTTESVAPAGAFAAGIKLPKGMGAGGGELPVKAMGAGNELPKGLGYLPSGLPMPAPTGKLGGPAIAGARGRLGQIQLPDVLREAQAQRTAKDPTALPMVGVRQEITPPDHIRTLDDFHDAVNRYTDLVLEGASRKDWYPESGQAIIQRTGGDTQTADAFGAGLARTSPRTDVDSNTGHGIKAHNQAMVGDPIKAGSFPNDMGRDLEKIYYGGERPDAEKIGPFYGGVANQWNPDAFPHQYVNDIWNMRAAEYKNADGTAYEGSPTAGEHNYTRILADAAKDELQRRGYGGWRPDQIQASAWSAIKARMEGTSVEQAGSSFAQGLDKHSAQISWESAPGVTTNHMPEYFSATPEQQQEYHDAIRKALTDENGRDLISAHLGLLTGPDIQGPGVFQGRVSPGSQTPVAVGSAPGGSLAGLDPASRDLAVTAAATKGALLRQDAMGLHKPVFLKSIPVGQRNLADVNLGRPLTSDEAVAVTQAMHNATGTDFHSPITTPNGFRFLNVPEASGIDNKAFMGHVQNALEISGLPDLEWRAGYADGDYIPNNWKEQPLGQGYFQRIAATGRPDLQRRADDLFATLGPRVAAVEDDFANRYGWTPDRSTRFWEHPDFTNARAGANAPQVSIPSPPQPWASRPGPQSPGATGFPALGASQPANPFPFAAAAPGSLSAAGAIPSATP